MVERGPMPATDKHAKTHHNQDLQYHMWTRASSQLLGNVGQLVCARSKPKAAWGAAMPSTYNLSG